MARLALAGLIPATFAISGIISGIGFESAKIIGLEFIDFIISEDKTFGLLTPIKISVLFIAELNAAIYSEETGSHSGSNQQMGGSVELAFRF